MTKSASSGSDSRWLTGDTKDLDPELRGKLQTLGKRIGKTIESVSGNRTFEEQAQLYAAYRAGRGNLAAPPGSSNHERGAASDAYVDGKPLQLVAGDAAAKIGLGFPVGGEPWHVENVSGTKAPASSRPKERKGAPEGLDFIPWAAQQYGVKGRVLTEIARRESDFNPGAVNSTDINADSWKRGGEDTRSKGMFQFIKPTFDSFAPQARNANPKAWSKLGDLDHTDWRQQALTTAWAVRDGKGGNWATFDAAVQSAGGEALGKDSRDEAMAIVPKGRTTPTPSGAPSAGVESQGGSSGPGGGTSGAPAVVSGSGSGASPSSSRPSRSGNAGFSNARASGPTPATQPAPEAPAAPSGTSSPAASTDAGAGAPADAADELVPQESIAPASPEAPAPVSLVMTPLGRSAALDPASGVLFDTATGYAVDPASGMLVDPASGWFIEPRTWTWAAVQPAQRVPVPANGAQASLM